MVAHHELGASRQSPVYRLVACVLVLVVVVTTFVTPMVVTVPKWHAAGSAVAAVASTLKQTTQGPASPARPLVEAGNTSSSLPGSAQRLQRHLGTTLPKDLSPVWSTADKGIECYADRDPGTFPRYQAWCHFERLCHSTNDNIVIPVAAESLAPDAIRIVGNEIKLVQYGAQELDKYKDRFAEDDLVIVDGTRTPHFPSWVDTALFTFGFQLHGFRFGMPRATVWWDRKVNEGVRRWIQAVTEIVSTSTGVRVHHLQRLMPEHTCFRAVSATILMLDQDATFESLNEAEPDHHQIKHERVSPRRHMFQSSDGIIWHHVVRLYARGSLKRQHVTVASQEDYDSLLGHSKQEVFPAVQARQDSKQLQIALIQRQEGRQFSDLSKLMQGVQHHLPRLLEDKTLVPLIRLRGFESYSLRAQIQTVMQADVMFAAHGAGGVNYVLMQPCAILYDVAPFNHFTPHFYGPPSENLGLVYAYGHFVPDAKHMPPCLPEEVRKPGASYTCMRLLNWRCRSCVRSMPVTLENMEDVSLPLAYAVLRQQQCRKELLEGLPSESLHGNMFVHAGTNMMTFTRNHETFDRDAMRAKLAAALAAMPEAKMYPVTPGSTPDPWRMRATCHPPDLCPVLDRTPWPM